MLEQHELQDQTDKKSAASTDRTLLAGLAQAALKADAVTGDPAWDTFCSYIQQAINTAKGQRAQYADALTSPRLVNHEQISIIRNEILIRDTRITDLEWVITMPAEIKRVGSVAKEKLAALDVKEDEGEVPDGA